MLDIQGSIPQRSTTAHGWDYRPYVVRGLAQIKLLREKTTDRTYEPSVGPHLIAMNCRSGPIPLNPVMIEKDGPLVSPQSISGVS